MAEPAKSMDDLAKLFKKMEIQSQNPSEAGSIDSALRDVESKFGDDSSDPDGDSEMQDPDIEMQDPDIKMQDPVRQKARPTRRTGSTGPGWDPFFSSYKEKIKSRGAPNPARRAPGPTINKILSDLKVDGIDINTVLENFKNDLTKAEEKDGMIDSEVNLIRGLIESYNTKPGPIDGRLLTIYEMIIEAKNELLIDSNRTDNILAEIIIANKDKLYQKRAPQSPAIQESVARAADIIRLKKQQEYLRKVEGHRRRTSFIQRAADVAKERVMSPAVYPISQPKEPVIETQFAVSEGVKAGKHENRGMLYALVTGVTGQQRLEATRRFSLAEKHRELAQGQSIPGIPGSVRDGGREKTPHDKLGKKPRFPCETCGEIAVNTWNGKRVRLCIRHLSQMSVNR